MSGKVILGKNELVALIAMQSGLTKKDAQQALSVTLVGIEAALAKGNDVNITGFGKFKVSNRPSRVARNPATGADVQVAASNKVTFTPGAPLKYRVNS